MAAAWSTDVCHATWYGQLCMASCKYLQINFNVQASGIVAFVCIFIWLIVRDLCRFVDFLHDFYLGHFLVISHCTSPCNVWFLSCHELEISTHHKHRSHSGTFCVMYAGSSSPSICWWWSSWSWEVVGFSETLVASGTCNEIQVKSSLRVESVSFRSMPYLKQHVTTHHQSLSIERLCCHVFGSRAHCCISRNRLRQVRWNDCSGLCLVLLWFALSCKIVSRIIDVHMQHANQSQKYTFWVKHIKHSWFEQHRNKNETHTAWERASIQVAENFAVFHDKLNVVAHFANFVRHCMHL